MTLGLATLEVPGQEAAKDGPTLAVYAQFVTRYRALLVFALATGLLGGLALHLSMPQRYTSTAHMVIVATTLSGVSDAQTDVSIDSALQLLRSDQVVGHVARDIDYPGGPSALGRDVNTRPIINSRILRISVAALDPDAAHEATTAVVNRFFDVRKQGLVSVALSQQAAVEAELAVVEAELAERFQFSPEDESTLLEELDDGQGFMDPLGVRQLVTRQTQLQGEKAFLEISEPNPGYLSRPPTDPSQGSRTGFAVTMSSVVTLSLMAAVGIATLHQMRSERMRRGQHRRPLRARRT